MSPVVLATGSIDQRLFLWDVVQTKILRRLEIRDCVNCLRIGGLRELLLAGGSSAIKMYALSRSPAPQGPSHGYGGAVSPGSGSRGGGGGGSGPTGGRGEEPVATLVRHTTNVTSLGFSPDEERFFSTDASGRVCIWDLRTHEVTFELTIAAGITDAALLAAKGAMVLSDDQGYLTVVDLRFSRVVESFSPHDRVTARPKLTATQTRLLELFAASNPDHHAAMAEESDLQSDAVPHAARGGSPAGPGPGAGGGEGAGEGGDERPQPTKWTVESTRALEAFLDQRPLSSVPDELAWDPDPYHGVARAQRPWRERLPHVVNVTHNPFYPRAWDSYAPRDSLPTMLTGGLNGPPTLTGDQPPDAHQTPHQRQRQQFRQLPPELRREARFWSIDGGGYVPGDCWVMLETALHPARHRGTRRSGKGFRPEDDDDVMDNDSGSGVSERGDEDDVLEPGRGEQQQQQQRRSSSSGRPGTGRAGADKADQHDGWPAPRRPAQYQASAGYIFEQSAGTQKGVGTGQAPPGSGVPDVVVAPENDIYTHLGYTRRGGLVVHSAAALDQVMAQLTIDPLAARSADIDTIKALRVAKSHSHAATVTAPSAISVSDASSGATARSGSAGTSNPLHAHQRSAAAGGSGTTAGGHHAPAGQPGLGAAGTGPVLARRPRSIYSWGELILTSLDLDQTRNVCYVSTAGGEVFVLDANAGWAVTTCYRAHQGRILRCRVAASGSAVATAAADGRVQVAKTSNPDRSIAALTGNVPGQWFWDCTLSSDGQYLLAGASDTVAYLWHTPSGKLAKSFRGHSRPVTALALNDTQKILE